MFGLSRVSATSADFVLPIRAVFAVFEVRGWPLEVARGRPQLLVGFGLDFPGSKKLFQICSACFISFHFATCLWRNAAVGINSKDLKLLQTNPEPSETQKLRLFSDRHDVGRSSPSTMKTKCFCFAVGDFGIE